MKPKPDAASEDHFIEPEIFLALHNVASAIVILDDKGRIFNLGTGVFVEYRGSYFFATAGHIARDAEKRTWILCRSETLQLSQPGSGRLVDQKIDNAEAAVLANTELKLKVPRWRIDQPRNNVLHRDVGLIEVGKVGPLTQSGQAFHRVESGPHHNLELGATVEIWGESPMPLDDDRLIRRTARVSTSILDLEPGLMLLERAEVKYFDIATEAAGGIAEFNCSTQLPQHMKGMSGGPVWLVGSPTSAPQLIGIQSGLGSGGGILSARLTDWMAAADEYLSGSPLDLEPGET